MVVKVTDWVAEQAGRWVENNFESLEVPRNIYCFSAMGVIWSIYVCLKRYRQHRCSSNLFDFTSRS